ncbi:MAG: LysR family transcriptional regulator [Pseudomonadota bacterium]
MPRNIDLAALRAFVTVAEIGAITRAAAQLNLTQSAVSLQIKRLEDALGQPLMHRGVRGVTLTARGERLLDHARRLLALNDETWSLMTEDDVSGEIRLGVPEDLLYPHVPVAMRAFNAAFPKASVKPEAAPTMILAQSFASGGLDLMLATEAELRPGGETLARAPLVWMGGAGGSAWQRRPLPLGTVEGCVFTRPAVETLNRSGLAWKLELDSGTTQAVEASMMADQVVHLQMRGTIDARFEEIAHGGALPQLPDFLINLYVTSGPRQRLAQHLADTLRAAYRAAERIAAE